MRVIFDSAEEEAAPGDDVTLGFFVESPDDQRSCSYRVEQGGLGASPSLWRVDGPTTLSADEPGRGALSVRAPDNPGTEDLKVLIRLVVSTPDPGAETIGTCTLVVRPATFSLRPSVIPNPDGTIGTKISILRRGRRALDAEVKFRHKGGWRFYPERPSITIHTNGGPVRVVAPRSRWYMPQVTLNPDGTVTVKVSLLNRGPLDVKGSLRLRHDDGWWFSPENPEITVRAAKGPVDVSATFRPPQGRQARGGDEVTVQLQYKGVPVADASVQISKRGAALKRASAVASLLPLALVFGGAFLDEPDPPPVAPLAATSVVPPPPPTIGEPLPNRSEEDPRPAPSPGPTPTPTPPGVSPTPVTTTTTIVRPTTTTTTRPAPTTSTTTGNISCCASTGSATAVPSPLPPR